MKVVVRCIGAVLMADGAAALARPRTYLKAIKTGSPLIDDILEFFGEKPELVRGVSLAEMSLGLWFLLR